MIDFSLIYNSLYLRTFGVALCFFIADLFFVLDKIRDKIAERKKTHDLRLEGQYPEGVSTKSLIELFDKLRVSRSDFDQIERNLDLNLSSGVGFLASCILGFVAEQSVLGQSGQALALTIMFTTFSLFMISLVPMFKWYFKSN